MKIDLPLLENQNIRDIVYKWAEDGTYRIVKYDLPSDELPWYLVRVSWFGSLTGVPGSDKGCPGEYNYQLITANNPQAILRSLTEVALHTIKPTKIKRHGRDNLPKAPIIKTIDIATLLTELQPKYQPAA